MPLSIKKTKIKALWQRLTHINAPDKTCLQTCGQQRIGRRDSQQDRFDILSDIPLAGGSSATLLLVADGMGGHLGGGEASEMVVTAFRQVFAQAFTSNNTTIAELFEQALQQSNQLIANYVAMYPRYDSMGSTVVAALVVEQSLYWLSIGDSPLWLIRNGRLYRLNEDHSMLPVLLKMAEIGEIDKEGVYQDSRRNLLRSVVQGKPVKLQDMNETPCMLEMGDTIVLASDGLQTLSEATITQLAVQSTTEPCEQAVVSMLDKIDEINHPGQDNTTVIVAQLNPCQSDHKTTSLGK